MLPDALGLIFRTQKTSSKKLGSGRKRFQSGGLLTDKGFTAVVEVIRQIAPQASTLLERFSQTRTERIRRLSARARDNLAQQKEALLTALSIAGLSRDPVQEWTPSDETPVSFLDGLPSVRLREDPMVVNDLQNLPGFEVVRTYPYGAAVFESEATSERLTVILANRLPLEEQTGTDLIYFNETYQSFVMVQYKAMEREDRRVGPAEAVYRLPNAQLKEEIDRMDTVLSALKTCAPNTGIGGFRLTEKQRKPSVYAGWLDFAGPTIQLTLGMYADKSSDQLHLQISRSPFQDRTAAPTSAAGSR